MEGGRERGGRLGVIEKRGYREEWYREGVRQEVVQGVVVEEAY